MSINKAVLKSFPPNPHDFQFHHRQLQGFRLGDVHLAQTDHPALRASLCNLAHFVTSPTSHLTSMPDKIREKELLALARGEASFKKTDKGASIEHIPCEVPEQLAARILSMPYEPQLHLVALSCWHILWCEAEYKGEVAWEATAPWLEWSKLLALDSTDFRRAVDERIAPDLAKHFECVPGNPATLVSGGPPNSA